MSRPARRNSRRGVWIVLVACFGVFLAASLVADFSPGRQIGVTFISIFGDIFRSDDLSGWHRAFWTIFVVVLPYLGVFVYLIARGHKMGEHAVRDASRREEQMRSYVQEVAGSGTSIATTP